MCFSCSRYWSSFLIRILCVRAGRGGASPYNLTGKFLNVISESRYFRLRKQDEFEMDMRLIGAPTLKDLEPNMVNTQSISSHVVPVPGDRLYDGNCRF